MLLLFVGCADASSSSPTHTLTDIEQVNRVAYTNVEGQPVIGTAIQTRLILWTRSIVVLDFAN